LCCEWIGAVVGFINAVIAARVVFQQVEDTVMHDQLPVIYVARHGDTAWSVTGQHTGLTDLPLTSQGEEHARGLRDRLKDIAFAKVFSSPLQRARATCTLAGFSSVAEIENHLVEWDYGKYEGLRSAEIHAERPDWDLFRDGAPGGETPAQVAERADSIWTRVRPIKGNVLLFSSGHFIRVLAARWIGLQPSCHCNSFVLGTASLSAFGYDRDLSRPVIQLWNDMHHVPGAEQA
jgi:probable phosphoglycerate mutase